MKVTMYNKIETIKHSYTKCRLPTWQLNINALRHVWLGAHHIPWPGSTKIWWACFVACNWATVRLLARHVWNAGGAHFSVASLEIRLASPLVAPSPLPRHRTTLHLHLHYDSSSRATAPPLPPRLQCVAPPTLPRSRRRGRLSIACAARWWSHAAGHGPRLVRLGHETWRRSGPAGGTLGARVARLRVSLATSWPSCMLPMRPSPSLAPSAQSSRTS
jgi:hypothetical protein